MIKFICLLLGQLHIAQVMNMVGLVYHNFNQILQVQHLLKNVFYINKLSAKYCEDQSDKNGVLIKFPSV